MAAASIAAPAFAADVGVSITIGEPNFYGTTATTETIAITTAMTATTVVAAAAEHGLHLPDNPNPSP